MLTFDDDFEVFEKILSLVRTSDVTFSKKYDFLLLNSYIYITNKLIQLLNFDIKFIEITFSFD